MALIEIDEQSIVAACVRGETEGFTTLYERYIERIYRFIFYRTHNRTLAEDLTSDAFMKVLDKIHTFNESRGNFSTWLYQIARNTLRDHYRTEHPTTDIKDGWEIADKISVENEVSARVDITRVQQYLSKLSAEQRDLIFMRVWDGLSFTEIAQVIGKSEAATKMSFGRLIAKLRTELPLALFLISIISSRINN